MCSIFVLLIDVIEVVDVIVGFWVFVFWLVDLFCFMGFEVGFGVFGNLEECFIKWIVCDLWKIKFEGMM